MASIQRTSSSSISSVYSSLKSSSIDDMLAKFHTIVNKVKINHERELECLKTKLAELESENRRLRIERENHPHSIFDIDYVHPDTALVDQLKAELKQTKEQIEALRTTVDQQYVDYQDIKSKYSLQRIINEKHAEQSGNTESSKLKEYESIVEKVKEQINQFNQCHFETEEQLHLLKQIVSTNDQSPKSITQSSTVKKSDLVQQTSYVESLLKKQNEQILGKLIDLVEQNSSQDIPFNKNPKKTKKKRL